MHGVVLDGIRHWPQLSPSTCSSSTTSNVLITLVYLLINLSTCNNQQSFNNANRNSENHAIASISSDSADSATYGQNIQGNTNTYSNLNKSKLPKLSFCGENKWYITAKSFYHYQEYSGNLPRIMPINHEAESDTTLLSSTSGSFFIVLTLTLLTATNLCARKKWFNDDKKPKTEIVNEKKAKKAKEIKSSTSSSSDSNSSSSDTELTAGKHAAKRPTRMSKNETIPVPPIQLEDPERPWTMKRRTAVPDYAVGRKPSGSGRLPRAAAAAPQSTALGNADDNLFRKAQQQGHQTPNLIQQHPSPTQVVPVGEAAVKKANNLAAGKAAGIKSVIQRRSHSGATGVVLPRQSKVKIMRGTKQKQDHQNAAGGAGGTTAASAVGSDDTTQEKGAAGTPAAVNAGAPPAAGKQIQSVIASRSKQRSSIVAKRRSKERRRMSR